MLSPAVTATARGALGGARGCTCEPPRVNDKAGPVPTAFVAATAKSYLWPFVNPVTTIGLVLDTTTFERLESVMFVTVTVRETMSEPLVDPSNTSSVT